MTTRLFLTALSLCILLIGCRQNSAGPASAATLPGSPSQSASSASPLETGPGNGGGGNFFFSTEAQVRAYLSGNGNGLNDDLAAIWVEIERSIDPKSAMPAQDPHAVEILKKIDHAFKAQAKARNIQAVGGFLTAQILQLAGKLNVQNDPCFYPGEGSRDASAVGDYGSGQICISVHQLQRQTPSSLTAETPALMIHELSHLVGYGEQDAVFIQHYVTDKFINGGQCIFSFLAEDWASPRNAAGDPKLWTVEVDQYDHGQYSGRRYSSPISEVEHGGEESQGVSLLTKISLVEGDLYGSWTPKQGGYIHFATGNADKTRTPQQVEFGPVECNGPICQAKIQSSTIQVNGKPLSVSGSAVNFSKKCLL